MKPRKLPPLVLAAAITATLPARAQGTSDQAAAASLFEQAKQLMSTGDFEHACPKFAEAQRLAPTPGTLLNLGNCYEKQGKLASAWGAFKEAEVASRNANDTDREREASRRAQALSMQLAKLAILVPPAARLPGFELRRDGVLVGEGQWGSLLPIDAGQHTIEAKATGRKPWSTWVRIDTNGASTSIEVPVLEEASSDPPPEAPPFWSGRRIAGTALGGAGLVGVITGAIAGGLAFSKASSAEPHCQPNGEATACDPTGLSLRSSGRTLANVSNVALAIGGAAVIGGVVLFATAPRSDAPKPATARGARPTATLSLTGNGLLLEGAW